jgi:hypothetical protein
MKQGRTNRYHQKLPSAGPEREALREKGQFWTPDWVANAMVQYVLSNGSSVIFDPAVGPGIFLRAAKNIAKQRGGAVRLLGTEIDPTILQQAKNLGLTEREISRVELRDFVLDPPRGPFRAIVANPPYIRHHRLSEGTKAKLHRLSQRLIGRRLDGRAGLHVYFLLRALELMAPSGRLAFIMPADTVEGVFADALWRWITSKYRLEAVVTFEHHASPFPGVDTNPVIFMIRNESPAQHFFWARCAEAGGTCLVEWVASEFEIRTHREMMVQERSIMEALRTGMSRPYEPAMSSLFVLGDFATALRGIATGANEFFHITADRACTLEIPQEFLVPAIGRTRDVEGDLVTLDTIRSLEQAGRPTLLFSPDDRPVETLPPSVRKYIREGEAKGIHRKPLIAMRRPWYKMEVRSAPPFLFAYLGRRNARFIRNIAGVRPLTGFLCVYPRRSDPGFIERLWEVLRDPETIKRLTLVGKSYGGGAIKVEPRALEKLPLPERIVERAGLSDACEARQVTLIEV